MQAEAVTKFGASLFSFLSFPFIFFSSGGGDYFNPQFSVSNVGGLPSGVNVKAFPLGSNYTTTVVGNYSTRWIEKVAFSAFIAFLAGLDFAGGGFPAANTRCAQLKLQKLRLVHVKGLRSSTALALFPCSSAFHVAMPMVIYFYFSAFRSSGKAGPSLRISPPRPRTSPSSPRLGMSSPIFERGIT